MFSIRKINPMVRAIGTMGAVAAVVGGVTFASLQSNTVALARNRITTGSASLAIGSGANCTNTTGTNAPGFNVPDLTPGAAPRTLDFCLANNSDVPLRITGNIPQDLSGSAAAARTTLSISCNGLGTRSGTLVGWHNGRTFTGGTLAAGDDTRCTASVSLASTFTGNETIPTFAIDFVGNQ